MVEQVIPLTVLLNISLITDYGLYLHILTALLDP